MLVCIGECLAEFAPNDGGAYNLGFAGDTFNAAWAAQVLLRGAMPVRYVTAIGTDWVSDMMQASIAESGIDAGFVRRVPDRSVGLYVIRVVEGERSFAYWRRDSAATRLADDPDFLARALADARMVLVSGISVAILPAERRAVLWDVLQDARRRGVEVAFDPNYRPQLWRDADEARAAISRFLQAADIALPTFDDEAELFGDGDPKQVAARIGAFGVRDVIVKNGTAPTFCRFDTDEAWMTVRSVVRPIDSTGAGDAFNGTFLACRLQGVDGLVAVSRAQEVAARAVLTRGALIPRDSD